MTTEAPAKNMWLVGTIAVLIAVRIVAVLLYPGTSFPDHHLYVAYAEIISSGTDWLSAMEVSPLPVTGFRAIGYPLILAGAKILAGENFILLVQIVQTAITILAFILLYRAAQKLLASSALASLATLGFGLSVNLAYEVAVLPDSLLISTWVILVATALHHWLEGTALRPGRAFGLGVLALLIVMARGNGIHLLLLTLPIIALACFQPNQRKLFQALSLVLVYLPGVLAFQGVSEWNQQRTGERFFTTGGQIALVQPVFRMARLGAIPFDGDDLLRRTFREKAPDLRYEQIYDVNRSLFIDHGMSPKQIADANFDLYLRTVGAYPTVFGKMLLQNFDRKLATGLLNPAFGLHEAHLLATGERVFPGFSKIIKKQEGGIAALPYAVIYAIGMAASIVVFIASVLITPYRIVRRYPDRTAIACGALWLSSLAVLAYYSALFMELRYVIMVSPFLIMVGIWAIRRRRIE